MLLDENGIKHVIEAKHFLVGGSKEAGLRVHQKIRQILLNPLAPVALNNIDIQALEILVAAASDMPDIIPQQWQCEGIDCYASPWLICHGEMNVNKTSNNLCPFYSVEDK